MDEPEKTQSAATSKAYRVSRIPSREQNRGWHDEEVGYGVDWTGVCSGPSY